jgi:DNA-binding transcriptional LysR family regulator
MNQYETFIAIVESGSYSAAAKKLYKSPSALSKHISNIEEQLGVQLFDRTTRSLSITEEGKIYYERCKEINLKIKAAENEIKSAAKEPCGSIKITWPAGLAYSKLSELLGEFTRLYPKIRLDIISSNDVLCMIDKSIDIAFRTSPKVDSSLVGIELFSVQPVICASKDFIERFGYAKSIEDIAQMPNILPSYLNLAEKVRPKFPGFDQIKLEEQHWANDISTVHQMTRNGIGAAFLFEHIAQTDLDEGRLVNLVPSLTIPPLAVYLVHHKSNHMPKKLRLLIDFLKKKFLYPEEG